MVVVWKRATGRAAFLEGEGAPGVDGHPSALWTRVCVTAHFASRTCDPKDKIEIEAERGEEDKEGTLYVVVAK